MQYSCHQEKKRKKKKKNSDTKFVGLTTTCRKLKKKNRTNEMTPEETTRMWDILHNK